MTHAPVAVVAALRETSIVFATGISALVLRESVGRGRVAVTLAIAAGRWCCGWGEVRRRGA